MAYDKHYRARVVEYILEGHTQIETSRIFKVGVNTIKTWIGKHKATGTAGGGYTVANRNPSKLKDEKLVAYMKEHPDAFLREIAEEFSCCNEGARKALARNNITLKKDATLQRAQRGSKAHLERRDRADTAGDHCLC